MRLALLCLALLFAVFTQFTHLWSVPGLHYDEAWQGVFAYRIAAEQGFWPLVAMNSYTSPIIHYLLAGAFKLFGPTLLVMRSFLGAMNLLTLGLVVALLWRKRQQTAAFWFALFWALLPMSVHNHRFYVEVTTFHGLCLAGVLWAAELINRKPRLAFALATVSTIAASYSHILFICVFAATIVAMAVWNRNHFNSEIFRMFCVVNAALLIPLAVRMGLGLGKPLPFALAAAFAALAIVAVIPSAWAQLGRFLPRTVPLIGLAAVPYAIFFIVLLWNGFWAYAQPTGDLNLWWLPVNAILLIALLFWPKQKNLSLSNDALFVAALALFVFSSIITFKQASRYYMLTSIVLMLWCAIRLSEIKSRSLQAAIAAAFVAWNSYAFEARYITQYEQFGSTAREFRLWIFHDSGKDFRPYQKAFAWAKERNCHWDLTPHSFESDRDQLAFHFLKLSSPPLHNVKCPWQRGTLKLTSIPPAEAKLLAHFADWGDLDYWLQKETEHHH